MKTGGARALFQKRPFERFVLFFVENERSRKSNFPVVLEDLQNVQTMACYKKRIGKTDLHAVAQMGEQQRKHSRPTKGPDHHPSHHPDENCRNLYQCSSLEHHLRVVVNMLLTEVKIWASRLARIQNGESERMERTN